MYTHTQTTHTTYTWQAWYATEHIQTQQTHIEMQPQHIVWIYINEAHTQPTHTSNQTQQNTSNNICTNT